jgi:hypothetical protein
MKWGKLYPIDYVNVLFSACRKYISGDFRFVCLTDDPKGLDPKIEHFPIPDLGLSQIHYDRGAWPKVAVFLSDLYGLTGRALFIDLDTYVINSLNEMFDYSGKFIAIDWRPWRFKTGSPLTMSSIFSFDLGSLGEVAEKLRLNVNDNVSRYRIEQNYLHNEISNIRYWPQEWVVSFKYHLRQPLLIDRFRPPNPPPQTAKILAFHGRPRPADLLGGYVGNWDLFPHYGAGEVAWMRDYWVEHGGRLPMALR